MTITIERSAADKACWNWFKEIRAQARHPKRQSRIRMPKPVLTQE